MGSSCEILNICIFTLLASSCIVTAQRDITLELLQSLENQIAALNKVTKSNSLKVDTLSNTVSNLLKKQAADSKQALDSIINTNRQVAAAQTSLNTLQQANLNLNTRIDWAEDSILNTTLQVERLEKMNKMWKANFRVVNKTFTALRKRYTFARPVIALPSESLLG